MFLDRIFRREPTASESASVLAKRNAELRRSTFIAMRDEKLALFRADIAAGRIAQLGWKQ